MQKYSNILQLMSFLQENKQTKAKNPPNLGESVCACVSLSMLHYSYQTRTHRSISQPSTGKAPVCEWTCVFASVYRIAPSFLPRLMSSEARPENSPMKMEKQRYTGKTLVFVSVCLCLWWCVRKGKNNTVSWIHGIRSAAADISIIPDGSWNQ